VSGLLFAPTGAVAYKLELPASSSVHPVFHVSQLKKYVGSQLVSPVLPDDTAESQVPEQVLQRRWTDGASPVNKFSSNGLACLLS
jgi:hypothetical protein